MKRLLIVNVLLLAIVVGLVVQIVALWWRAEAAVEPAAPREAKTQRLDVPSAVRKPPPPDLAKLIAEKDLFDQTRSAAATTGPGPTDAPPVALNVALYGITVAGGAREALIKDQAQPKPFWLREGEEYNGYKLRRIDPTSVVMVAPSGDEITLMINVERSKGSAAPATGPAGIQPPAPAAAAAGRATPAVPRPAVTPAPDIKEKIERLREEARKRRQNKVQQAQ